MPVPARQGVKLAPWLVACALACAALTPPAARAAPADPKPREATPLHWTGDRNVWDRKKDVVELDGNAAVHQPGETIRADHITLDKANRSLVARGRCVYITAESVIYGDSMTFDLDTRTGVINGGRVANERFTLTGEKLEKLGEGHYRTTQGSYTTCVDCPASWTLQGADVDLQIGGYARMSNVSTKVLDAPLFWLPYLIVPLKTERQTGLLFPRIGFSDEGFKYVLPFFWAISRSADMTLGVGEYAGHGFRLEWEGRYSLSDRSDGRASFFLLRDRPFEEYLASLGLNSTSTRWAIDVRQRHELPFGIEQKLLLTEYSDNFYPSRIGDGRVGDSRGSGEATLASELFFSGSTEHVSAYVAFRRFRNLISLDPDPRVFDSHTVQAFPTAELTSNDRLLFGLPVAAGVAVGVSSFSRTTDPFDRDVFTPNAPGAPVRLGIDPIREATRASVTPSVYAMIRPWNAFSLVPSLEYRAHFYSFHNELPNLSRGYPLFQAEFSTQLERIFEMEDPNTPRMKHLLRPSLTYNRIPVVHEPGGHPFLEQIRYAQNNGFAGFNFDNRDIVPVATSRNYNNYFTPLGHSMTGGFVTQWIERKGKLGTPGTYHRLAELRAAQTVDLLELEKATDRQPFSRLTGSGFLSLPPFDTGFDYSYYPYAALDGTTSRHVWSLGASYVFDRTVHQRIFEFERSVALGYSFSALQGANRTENIRLSGVYSLSDHVLSRGAISYDLASLKLLSLDLGLRIQPKAQCYRFELTGGLNTCAKTSATDTGICSRVGLDFNLNLTGSGFGGFSDVAAATGIQ